VEGSNVLRKTIAVLTGAVALSLALGTPATALVTDGLFLNLDARNSASVNPTSPTQWIDLSTNGFVGTVSGDVGFDATNKAMTFGGNGFVQLEPMTGNFSNGFTIEFYGNLGEVNEWERVMDLGNGENNDNLILTRDSTTDTLVVHIQNGSVYEGHCVSPVQSNLETTAYWTFVVDPDASCRVYRNGVTVEHTMVSGDSVHFNAMPAVLPRTLNYIAMSNWVDDGPAEGSFRIVRLYERALTEGEVTANVNEVVPSALAETGIAPVLPALVAATAIALGVAIRRRARS
jgi:hypothetical protein